MSRGVGQSLGYEDVALLDIFLTSDSTKGLISQATAKKVRERAYKKLVKEYMKIEGVHELDAEIEVDAIVCCMLIEKKGENINCDLN